MLSSLPHRIAIVDDDVGVLESICFLLETSGCTAQPFVSASNFLACLPKAGFDRLILDHHMPHMTGLELVGHLRAGGVHIPTMLISGSLTPDMVDRARKLRIERVIEKPVPEAELMVFIDTAEAARPPAHN